MSVGGVCGGWGLDGEVFRGGFVQGVGLFAHQSLGLGYALGMRLADGEGEKKSGKECN